MTRVLVVEDEESFSDALSFMLRREGFEVVVAATGPEGLLEFDRTAPDLVLLDVMLPGLSGTEVCRTLRQRSDVPVIMLTARDSEIDKVVGLEIGADDYVTKPFSPRELVARVGGVLRRTQGAPAAAPQTVGAVTLDASQRRVFSAEGELALTVTEFDLLAYLMRRPGRVFTREQLLSEVWGYSSVAGTRTVDVHIAQLRAKLGAASPIRTVRGVGYAAENTPA